MAVEDISSNVLSLANARAGRRASGGRTDGTDARPVVRVVAGELGRVIDEAEAVLATADANLYQFGGSLVQVAPGRIRVSGGRHETSLRLSPIGVAGLVDRFGRAVDFQKWSKTEKDWMPCDCPKQVAESYLARDCWAVRPLLGIVTAPTVRADGSVLDAPGYDPATGLVYDPQGVAFPPIPVAPTRDDALAALSLLRRLLRHFKFVSPADRSVALSGIVTSVVRTAMPVAPMHAFDAPTAGSGKSYLVDVAAVIATGHRAAVIATGSDKYGDNEIEKRLSAAVLGGDGIVSLDNVEEPLGGQLLCQLMTQHTVKIRPFGKLVNVVVPSVGMYFANGNNFSVLGDMTRRTLAARIDPQTERPELEEYLFNPVELARRARPLLVRAAVTVVVAHRLARPRPQRPPLGSYDEWSRLVRDALVWLGEADPTDVMERMRSLDPKLGGLTATMTAWDTAFGCVEVRTREVIEAADAVAERDEHGRIVRYADPDLRDAVVSVASGRGGLSPDRLGWWLRKNLGRTVTVDGRQLRFVQSERTTQGAVWCLEGGRSLPPGFVEPRADRGEIRRAPRFPADDVPF